MKISILHCLFEWMILIILTISLQNAVAQTTQPFTQKSNKNKFYVYWGWNRDAYTNSDIHFHGINYDFTLADLVAKNKQSAVGVDPCLAPLKVTIPQTNFRIGYFITDHWSLSLGLDHMKYVMVQDQTVDINGSINNSNTNYDGGYQNSPIKLTSDFLQFEHTDGLIIIISMWQYEGLTTSLS